MAHLVITIQKLCKPKDDDDNCDTDNDDLPPLPSPPPTLDTHSHSHSPLKLLLICALAATLSFCFYVILIKTRRAVLNRRRRLSHQNLFTTDTQTHLDHFNHEHDHDHEPVVFHPVWLINTIGLDQSLIDSIQMFNYTKDSSFIIHSNDCSICLGVFEEGESLRVLPKCSHAFHVACIDTWLRSHTNCPLCRAPVVNNSSSNSVGSSTVEGITSGGYGNRSSGVENTQGIDANGGRVQSDLSSYCCQKVEPIIRRSVSMGSYRFVDQELVVSQKPDVGSSTVEEGRALRSG